jgi:hypothetical protein
MVKKSVRISFKNPIVRIPKEIVEKHQKDKRHKYVDLDLIFNDPDEDAFYMAAKIAEKQ